MSTQNFSLIIEEAKLRRATQERVNEYLMDENEIRDLCVVVCNTYRLKLGDDYENVESEVIQTLLGDAPRRISSHVTIDEGFTPWFIQRKANLELTYWNKYASILGKEHPSKVIYATDDDTDQIMDRIGDPENKAFNKRGLVMGNVQMGKTMNYIGLITKAADAGYKFIVVIAGATEALRQQTQSRVDDGFLGRESSLDGEIPSVEELSTRPNSLTGRDKDFNSITGLDRANLYRSNMPMVVVIKKNAKVLESLIHWVEKAHFLKGSCVPSPEGTHCPICRKKTIRSTEGPSAIESQPMLLLDDEADYASVNTNDAAKRVTRINELLRILLSKFHQKSYVGYTATPFANIFINSESLGDESVEDDLFPRHFIHQIGTPSNYQGPATFFGPDGNPNLIKPIGLETDEKIENFYNIEKEINPDTGRPSRKVLDATFSGIPDELKEAIRNFILNIIVRKLRGHINQHNTMMINIHYLTKVNNALTTEVRIYLEELKRACNSFYKLPYSSAIKNRHISDLEETFNKEFLNKGIQIAERDDGFKDILKNLNLSKTIETLSINFHSKNELDYESYRSGRNVIVIGGFSLSRGLTLEGLSVTFFDRTTKFSDTLLQMGRWFGYRPRFEEICRVYIDNQSLNFYEDITETISELSHELKLMNQRKRTPLDFGLAVREHPGLLQITAKNKMRTATILTSYWSFWGTKYQSKELYNDDVNNQHNLDITRVLANNLTNLDEQFTEINNGRLWRNIDSSLIEKFLEEFSEPPATTTNHDVMVRKFIEDIKIHYNTWSVWIYSNQSASSRVAEIFDINEQQPVQITDSYMVYPSLRIFSVKDGDKLLPEKSDILSVNRAQILATDVESRVLTDIEKDRFDSLKENDEFDTSATLIARTAMKSPLLVIFPLAGYVKGRNDEDEFPCNDDVDCHIGFSLSFPNELPNGMDPPHKKHQYAFTQTAIDQGRDIVELEDELEVYETEVTQL